MTAYRMNLFPERLLLLLTFSVSLMVRFRVLVKRLATILQTFSEIGDLQLETFQSMNDNESNDQQVMA